MADRSQGIKLPIKRNIGWRSGQREHRTPVIKYRLADSAADVASGITHPRHRSAHTKRETRENEQTEEAAHSISIRCRLMPF